MIEIEDIRDGEDLKTWLTEWPEAAGLDETEARALAVTIAHRAAMRVLPLWWRWYVDRAKSERDVTALSVLWCLLISGVAGKSTTEQIKHAAVAAEVSTRTASAAAAADTTADPTTVTIAASKAATKTFATWSSVAARLAASSTRSADAAGNAAGAVNSASSASAVYAAFEKKAANRHAARGGRFWDALHEDCRTISERDEVLETPLWFGHGNAMEPVWATVKRAAVEPEWAFWIDWYEDALAGRVPDWGLLEKTALINREIWEAGPVEVAAAIEAIIADRSEHRHSELFNATIFDFGFDQMAGVMRAIPMPGDWKHLDEPDRLHAFLEDATDLREDMVLFCKALAAEGAGMQGAGTVRTYFDAVLSELQRAEHHESLRVGKLLEYGRILEAASQREDVLAEFGLLAEPLKQNIGNLRELIRSHFAATLARFAVLRDIRMEEDANPWEVLREFRFLVRDVRSGAGGDLPALAEDDVAVLDDVLDSVDVLIRSMEGAQSDAARASFSRELDFQMAKVGATAEVYRERAAQAVGQTGKAADEAVRWHKRIVGLAAFGRFVRDMF